MTDHPQAQIEADADVPIIRIVRDFAASPAQLYRDHTDPDLYARWVGPNDIPTRLVQTLTFDGRPDGVSLETLTFTDLGVNDGYAKLDTLLTEI
jgi:uncharacterized protein YndB with AHSA1/START domain